MGEGLTSPREEAALVGLRRWRQPCCWLPTSRCQRWRWAWASTRVTPAWGGGNLCDRTRLPQHRHGARVREPGPLSATVELKEHRRCRLVASATAPKVLRASEHDPSASGALALINQPATPAQKKKIKIKSKRMNSNIAAGERSDPRFSQQTRPVLAAWAQRSLVRRLCVSRTQQKLPRVPAR